MMNPITFFLWALVLLFIGLKLTGFISWSWWLVAAPILGPLALAGLLYAIAGVIWLCSSKATRDRLKLEDALKRYSTALLRK